MRRIFIVTTACMFVTAIAYANPDLTPDSNATVVFLRTDCNVNGNPMENCFESMAALSDPSTGWIWNTRNPTSSAPLLVVVGPGEFDQFVCPNGRGYVSLRGSGREQTIIAGSDTGMSIRNCEDLSFTDLGIRGGRIGVQWIGGGFSTWSDTDIVVSGETSAGTTGAWGDLVDASQQPFVCGTHYFHGSRVRATGGGSAEASAFYSQCGESWFFGGEILNEVSKSTRQANAVRITSPFGDVRTFGTAIREVVTAPVSIGDGELVGVVVSGGHFHSHGSVINVDARGVTNASAVGLSVISAGFAHTPEAAWVLTPDGSGTTTRVRTANGGVAQSPYVWQSGSAPPVVTSQHGSDLFVETDCNSSDCNGHSDPHLMIYSSNCTGSGGPWFDVVRQSCRN